MKRITAILTALVIVCSNIQAECPVKTGIKKFNARVKARIEEIHQRLHDRLHSPDVQMMLAEIKEKHREAKLEILEKGLELWCQYKEDIRPMVRAQAGLIRELLKFELKRRFKLWRPVAAAWYDAQIEVIISAFPPQVQIPLRIIRNNPVYKAARRKLADALIKIIGQEIEKLAVKARKRLREHMDRKLDELELLVRERIAYLSS
jgi:hypothetical protein